MAQKTKDQLLKEIDGALDMVRGGIALHNGGVDLVDVDVATGVATVRLRGTCVGCPMSDLTLKSGIEEAVRMMVPEITEVVSAPSEQEAPAHAC